MASAVVALAGCSTSTQTASKSKPRSKEYFAESAYGVKASPRVSNKRSNLPRGGGRDQTGKPYKVAGKWYYPKEDRNYRKTGAASWYGDAVHGRLTANGEVYDMTHLTAAHPTMPLPSYARVTNTENGASVIVRVNDRGPFHGNRIIDLSKRAAQMLDYTHAGVAKVQVEYVGRAPLHGQDDQFLMASYRPAGGRAPHPGDNVAPGVMIAMNGPTPTSQIPNVPVTYASASPAAARFPGAPASPVFPGAAPTPTFTSAPQAAPTPVFDVVLPDFGPIVPERPPMGYMVQLQGNSSLLHSYADERIERATAALDALAGSSLTPEAVAASWKQGRGGEHIAVATFGSLSEAQAARDALAGLGRALVTDEGGAFGLELHPSRPGANMDEALQIVWQRGYLDAMTVRQ